MDRNVVPGSPTEGSPSITLDYHYCGEPKIQPHFSINCGNWIETVYRLFSYDGGNSWDYSGDSESVGSRSPALTGTFSDYHDDDQSLGSVHYWGCPMFGGNVRSAGFDVTGFGIFHDWKMSGPYYNNYADPRVGSRLSKN